MYYIIIVSKVKNILRKDVKLVLVNAQHIFLGQNSYHKKLIRKFHGTIPLEELSSKIWSMRQYHSQFLLEIIVNY